MSSSSLAQGELIAERYQVTRLIGSGGMGEVYEAWDLLLKEDVALKTLRADLTHKESVVLRFQKEIQLARRVTHPNVCRIFEVGIRPGDVRHRHLLFFAMELLKGETLSARIRKGKLTRSEAFPIAIQLSEGLEAAHRAGVVHSDFKSGNIILVPMQGKTRAVITDFGLARMGPNWISSDETDTQTEDLQMAGTVATMSPEQMTGGAITPASDIYSLGIVLYEMATGGLPFHDRHVLQSAMQRGDRQSISVRSKVPDIDPRWEAAIARCLQRDPANRFASAGEIANWFQEGAWQNPRYWTRREWIRNSAGAAIAVTAGTGGWVWWNRPYQPLPDALEWYKKGVEALHSMIYESARRALENAVKEDSRFALAHSSLARAYDELDNNDKAAESMMQAISISKEIRLSSDDARKLEAMRLMVSRDYSRGVRLFQQIYDHAAESEKPAAALESGWLAQQHEETDAAVAAYELALKLDPSYAAAKLRMAFMLGRALNDEMALSYFREARDLYNSNIYTEGVTETLYQWASFLNRRNRGDEAMPLIEEALNVSKGVDNPYQKIRLQLLQSMVFGKRGDFDLASELAQQAKKQADKQNMDNVATGGFIDLGNIYLISKKFETAEPFLKEGLERAKRGKWPRNTARAQASLGSLYEQEQQPEKVREFVEPAIRFYSQAGYRRELVQTSGILGSAFGQLGEYDKGLSILQDAVPNAKHLTDKRLEGQLLERVANTLRDRGDWLKALEQYELAAGLYGQGNLGEVLVNSAGIQWRLGRHHDAEHSLNEAQFLAKKSDNFELLLLIRVQQGEFAYAYGDLQEALAQTQISLPKNAARDAVRELTLLRALILMRHNDVTRGLDSATSVIDDLSRSSLTGDAASARLAVAQALTAAGKSSLALNMARGALTFFEPRRVWEAVLRGHLVAARASQKHADVEVDLSAARVALENLKTSWPSEAVDSYRERPDIRLLSSSLL